MVSSGTKMRRWPLREGARSAPESSCYLTSRCLNPLTSFVLHMMCHNCVSAGRRRRTAALVAIDSESSVWEKDDIVELIEEWEADAETDAA